MGLLKGGNESRAQSEKKLQEIIKDQLQFERTMKLNVYTVVKKQ